MPNLEEIRANRIKKLEKIKTTGENPYPLSTKRSHTVKQVLKQFQTLKKNKKEIIIAGRIIASRSFGSLAFVKIEDGTDRMQAIFATQFLGQAKFDIFSQTIEVGDFIEIKGTATETKTKEKSIQANDFKILSKALRPLPEKWHGLQDLEERYRKRYLDLIFNKDIKEKFELRSKIISSIRNFLGKEGFLEVETPILQPLYGGAKAKPFKTYLNAMGTDVFLRVAPELYLKRLIIGGYEKVFEIGKAFRNEGVDKFHNPDFTILEFYWAYADYKDMMKLTEKMFLDLTKNTFKKTKIEINGQMIDFKGPWERIEFNDLLKKYAGVDYDFYNVQALEKKAKELGVEIEKGAGKAEIADEIYKKYCRPKLIQPTFIIHHPVGFQPLAKAKDNQKLANFQMIVAGTEIINAFSELNDPLEQETRFQEQEKLFKQGFSEAQQNDKEFVEALEYGMPPCAGFGMGIDRLVMLLTNASSLRDAILFPLMKPR
ncbi:MAG TPA: lysine--tRNA ligase [Candidatus Pacearchaeota archaeon]|nr:lysine--tRNA ligase [Candidatus Pacearchaeota archaeon]